MFLLCLLTSIVFYLQGKVNQNFDPLPGFESTPISPRRALTIVLQIDNPSPVPCLKEFTLVKRSKIASICTGEMPMPVSLISNST